MSWYHPKTLIDKVFEGSIVLKGISGVLDFIGGLLLIFIKPSQLHQFITLITQRELIEDPNDIIANFLLQTTSQITNDVRVFFNNIFMDTRTY